MNTVTLYKRTRYVLGVELEDGRWLVTEGQLSTYVAPEEFHRHHEPATEEDVRHFGTVIECADGAADDHNKPRVIAGENADPPPAGAAPMSRSAARAKARHLWITSHPDRAIDRTVEAIAAVIGYPIETVRSWPAALRWPPHGSAYVTKQHADFAKKNHEFVGAKPKPKVVTTEAPTRTMPWAKYDWTEGERLWVHADPAQETRRQTCLRIAEALGITAKGADRQVYQRADRFHWPARGSARARPATARPTPKPPRLRSDNVTACPDCKAQTDAWPCGTCGSTSGALKQRISSLNGELVHPSHVGGR